jgi:integrase
MGHAIRFTSAAIEKLKAPIKGQTFYWDTDRRRFGLKVSHTGSKTYIVTCRVFAVGQWQSARRFTVGRHPEMKLAEARDRARDMLALAKARKSPALLAANKLSADIERSVNTFEAISNRFMVEYLEAKGRRPATVQQYRLLFDGKDLAAWRNRPIAEITFEDVKAVLAVIMRRGKRIAANRTLAYLRKFFTWAVRERIIPSSPAMGIDLPAGETPRDRVLSDGEIVDIWKALDAEPGPVNLVGKLLIMTGQRRGEVAGMRWSELRGLRRNGRGELEVIAGERPTWDLLGRRTKNHRDHVVPLTPQTVDILRTVGQGDADLAFSNNGKVPILLNAKLRNRIAKASGVTGWSWHDLRRTFATGLGRLKVSRFIIGKIINHADRSMTSIYERHEFFEEKLEALTRWADHVDRLLAVTPALDIPNP